MDLGNVMRCLRVTPECTFHHASTERRDSKKIQHVPAIEAAGRVPARANMPCLLRAAPLLTMLVPSIASLFF